MSTIKPGSLASSLKDVLEQASSVDLFHLTTILERLLSDPARVIAVKRNLRMGQTVRFLDFSDLGWQPALLKGKVVAMTHHQLTVLQEGVSRQWKLPYAAIDIESCGDLGSSEPKTSGLSRGFESQAQARRAETPDRDDFKAGDQVSFEDQYMVTHVGTIKRVNQYTATVICDGGRWRVAFQYLRHVVDL